MKSRFLHFILALFTVSLLISPAQSSWNVATGKQSVTGSATPNAKAVAFVRSISGSSYSDTYYDSVASAINKAVSGNIVFLVPPKQANYDASASPTPDKVSYELTENATIGQGVSFVIPTDTSTMSGVTSSSGLTSYISRMQADDGSLGTSVLFATANQSRFLRVTLNIADGITLTNNGTIVVSGYLTAGNSSTCTLGQTAYSYSKICLGSNSKINQSNSSANIYCYGYISEQSLNNSSQVNIGLGSLYLPYIIRDFRGFIFSWSMTVDAIDTYRCAPFNQMIFLNVDSLLKVSYSGKVYGSYNIFVTYTSPSINQYFHDNLSILGSSSGFAFQFSNSTYSSLTYKYNPSTGIADIKVFGGLTMNSISLSLSASGLTIDLSTKNAYFPFSYEWNIEFSLASGQTAATFSAPSQRVKMLPGSSLIVGSGCTVTGVELIAYSAFYDGALGNGKSSINEYSGVAYPLKKGATIEVLDTGKITMTSLAGTVYCNDSSNITYTNSSISVNEAWCTKTNTSLQPPRTVKDYLEIREELSIHSVADLNKKRLFVGMNTFKVYTSFVPSVEVITDSGASNTTVSNYQKVLFFDSISNYQLNFVSNIFASHYSTSAYKKSQVIAYSDSLSICGVTNSILSISNNNNGVNEFNIQSVTISCSTPTVNGQIPLYIGSTIQLVATLVDSTKAYDTSVSWSSSNPSIATIASDGKVTGVALGTTTITAVCDGVTATFQATVIEEITVDSISSVYITSITTGHTSETSTSVAGNDGYVGSYNGSADNGNEITYQININPASAPYSSILWTFSGSSGNRQKVKDSGAVEVTSGTKWTLSNSTTITIHYSTASEIGASYVTGTSSDEAILQCVVTPLSGGSTFSSTFIICHNADTSCLIPGTMIALADGSMKPIEDIKFGDYVKTWSFEKGCFESQMVMLDEKIAKHDQTIIRIGFDDGTNIGVSWQQSFFDVDSKKYFTITPENASEFIGRNVFVAKASGFGKAKIISATVSIENIASYEIETTINYNIIANGVLSVGPVIVNANIFDVDDNFKWNEQRMSEDIAKYGLFTYSDFSDYSFISEDLFIGYNAKYFKVAIGKGEFTFDELISAVKTYFPGQ